MGEPWRKVNDFPSADYQGFVGKRVVRITQATDEGLWLTFDDGTTLGIAFSQCYGEIIVLGPGEQPLG